MTTQPASMLAPARPAADSTFTAAELMAMELPDPTWAVPGVLPEGLSILAGRPKLGKSWLALDIAIAVAGGGRALGGIDVEGGDVLYLALEDTKRRLQSRFGTYLSGATPPARLTLSTAWPSADRGGIEAIADWLTHHPQARLVVIDTFKRIRPSRRRGANLYDEDYDSIEILKNIADRFGVAILVVHHVRKMTSDDPLDAVSGTAGLTGAADGVLVLTRDRHQADATLFVTGRDLDEQELALRWHAPSARWSVAGLAADFRMSNERAEILRLLATKEMALGPTEVAQALGKPVNSVKKLMWTMGEDGQLRSASGKYTVAARNLGNAGNLDAAPSQNVTDVTEVTARAGARWESEVTP